MTAPRQICPGKTYFVTRRCTQRQFLLRPSPEVTALIGYVLAVAAARTGVLIHTCVVMSSHVHMVLTDPEARLPEFSQYLWSLVARALNASLGRWESFWAPSSYSAVLLETHESVVEKTAYALTNPVKAGLVRSGREWPGLWSGPEQVGTTLTFERPAFFRAEGPMPASAQLTLTPPQGCTADEYRRLVEAELAASEEEARAAVTSSGRSFLGIRRVLSQDPLASPRTLEPRRNLSPRVAARDPWKRIEALARLRAFQRAYRDARARFIAGVRDVLFPAGTYLLRVMHGVRCEAPS
jgi:REP element-mobilizing transposase RayT